MNLKSNGIVEPILKRLDTSLIKVFRFQRKTLLLFYCFFFSIIFIIIIYLTDFVQPISRKRFDGFPWNFQDL